MSDNDLGNMNDEFLYEEIEYERRDLDNEWWKCDECDEHYNICKCDDESDIKHCLNCDARTTNAYCNLCTSD